MPTSATGISTNRAEPSPKPPTTLADACPRSISIRRRPGCAGFSLLELLVVIFIVGLFVSAVVLSDRLVRDDRDVEHEVRRLESLVRLVREEALMQSRDYGLLFGTDGYRFYVYDYETGAWLEPAGDELLAPHALAEGLELELLVEDRDLDLAPGRAAPESSDPATAEAPEPQVMILASGELTPFEAVVARETDQAAYRLTVELNGSTEVLNEAEDATGS